MSLTPHLAHFYLDVDGRPNRLLRIVATRFRSRLSPALKVLGDGICNEAAALRIDVPVAKAALAMGEETLRHHEMELLPRTRHCDVEQPAFFLDFQSRTDP